MATLAVKRHWNSEEQQMNSDKKWCHNADQSQPDNGIISIPDTPKDKLKVCFPMTDDDVNFLKTMRNRFCLRHWIFVKGT